MTKLQKLSSPSAERNKAPIGAELVTMLPQDARVLEIASGTGQHGAYFAELRPDIIWQYTDIDIGAYESQKAYVSENIYGNKNGGQLRTPLTLDVTKDNWWSGIAEITNIYCANMIHIAPWDAAMGLAKGAEQLLHTGDKLFLYGPFLFGKGSAQSNRDFAENLKQRNPTWGVRELADVKKLCASHNFSLEQQISMPRDNDLLVFLKN